MSGIPISYFLAVAAVLFAIGTVGVIIRRNALIALMSIELMLNAANLTLLAFGRARQRQQRHQVPRKLIQLIHLVSASSE